MERPEFKRPELEDKELIQSWLDRYPSRSCDRTFSNVFLWSRFYAVRFAVYQDTLLFRDNSVEHGFAWPAGEPENVKKMIETLVNWAKEDGKKFQLYGITKDNFALIEEWFPGKFTIDYQRDYADYVYEAEKLASLSGKKLHAKRNHINKFKKLYEGRWTYESIIDANIEECFQMALRWRNQNEVEEDDEKNAEMSVTMNSLRLFKELELTGGILRVDGEIAAFTMGEAVNKDTFVVHIEKAFSDIDGAYTVINQQFVEHEILGKYQYVNREDDVGQEGLRKAKLSYRPAFLVEKGVVTLAEPGRKENTEDDI